MTDKKLEKLTEGFATTYAFMLIVFLSIIFIGLSYVISSRRQDVPMLSDIINEKKVKDTVEEIIDAILEDNSPESDSLIDPVWNRIQSLNSEDFSVSMIGISSRVNLNFFRDEIIDGTDINKLLFIDGKSMSELEQYRHDNGLFPSLLGVQDEFLSDDAVLKYATVQSYMNINIADELALTELYNIRTGNDSGSESFRRKVQNERMNNTALSNNNLQTIMENNIDELYPFICAVPVMNIHFIPEELLIRILKYDFGNSPLPYPDRAYSLIIQSRESREFLTDELKSVFTIDDVSHPIFDYLGIKTWFWEIQITIEEKKYITVIAEIPDISLSYRPGDDVDYIERKRVIQIISRIISD